MNDVQCLILAGGLATRMRPVTDSIPKALIPVGPKPFIHYQLDWLKQHGVTDVVLSLGYRSKQVRDYVKDGSQWKLKLTCVDEGEDLKGTGGAIRLAVDKGVMKDKFLVTYGDSFLPVDFGVIYQSFVISKAQALMVVYKNDGRWDTSNVLFEKSKIVIYDKRHELKDKVPLYRHIDYGISAFDKRLIQERIEPNQKFDLAQLLKQLSEKGELAGFEVHERFYEIGSSQGLSDFKTYLGV